MNADERRLRIYVASSWRNRWQQQAVATLRLNGFEVYDFRNPAPGEHGFAWSEIDPAWLSWTPLQWARALEHPIARRGFARDFAAMQWADCCVLVLPSGRSSHLEAGWFAGRGLPVLTYCPEPVEPDLMAMLTDGVYDSMTRVIIRLEHFWDYRRSSADIGG